MSRLTTTKTFADDVLANDKPVLVDFWAAWCGPCRAIAPALDELAAENVDKLDVYKVNIDENRQLADAFDIRSIPALRVFVGGKIVKAFGGAMPKSALERELAAYLGR